jgi:hypothetical protein
MDGSVVAELDGAAAGTALTSLLVGRRESSAGGSDATDFLLASVAALEEPAMPPLFRVVPRGTDIGLTTTASASAVNT